MKAAAAAAAAAAYNVWDASDWTWWCPCPDAGADDDDVRVVALV